MLDSRFSLPSAVFLIIEQAGKVLLMRRANTSWHNGDFDLPAGHLDGGESSMQEAAREAKEELGIEIAIEDLSFTLLTHSLFSDGKEYYNLFFRVRRWGGTPSIMDLSSPQLANTVSAFIELLLKYDKNERNNA